nr:DegV family protein [Sedimentibacter sp.]
MNYEIVTDSSANLTEELIEKYGIHIISLFFILDGKEYSSYKKGEKTDIGQFYKMMRDGKMMTTSTINMSACEEVFEDILSKGKDVIYIGFSSALSGTYNTASIMAEKLREKYPERKIYSIDTLAASMGEGLLVYYAAKLKKDGKSIDEVKDWILDNRLNLCHWFTVDDLFFLKRGGRISSTTALVGTALGIKPILHVDDEGKLVNVGKVRGRKNSLNELVKEMEKTCVNPEKQTVFISHGDCIEDAEYVKELVKSKLKVKDIVINYVDPVIGAHSGPGTVALFYIGTNR